MTSRLAKLRGRARLYNRAIERNHGTTVSLKDWIDRINRIDRIDRRAVAVAVAVSGSRAQMLRRIHCKVVTKKRSRAHPRGPPIAMYLIYYIIYSNITVRRSYFVDHNRDVNGARAWPRVTKMEVWKIFTKNIEEVRSTAV